MEQRLERAMERNRALCVDMKELRDKKRARERAQEEAVNATAEAKCEAQLQRLRKRSWRF